MPLAAFFVRGFKLAHRRGQLALPERWPMKPENSSSMKPESGRAPDSSSRRGCAWPALVISLATVFAVAGLLAGAYASLDSTDWLGDGGSRYADPNVRDHINDLKALSALLWGAGIIAILAGGLHLVSRSQPGQFRAIVWGLVAGVPVCWLLVALLTFNQIDAANTKIDQGPVHSVSTERVVLPAGTCPGLSAITRGTYVIELAGSRFEPSKVDVRADEQITLIFAASPVCGRT